MNEDVEYENIELQNVEGEIVVREGVVREDVVREDVVREGVAREVVVPEGNGDAEYEELIRPGLFSAMLCCRWQTANESTASAVPGE